MAGLIPLNRKGNLTRIGSDFEDFYNMIDDFFSGPTQMSSNRQLLRDTFKIDIEETDDEYLVDAEVPGIKKEDVDLSIEGDNLLIKVNHQEEMDQSSKNYVHKERRMSAMSRSVRLANANLNEIKAKLEDGILQVTIPKDKEVVSSRKIDID